MTSKVVTHTFESTGETVTVPPVSYTSLLGAVRRDIPEPQPPAVTVTIAGITQAERNYADPDYAKGYALWEQTIQLECTARMLNRIAVKQRLNDHQKQQVEAYRADMAGLEKLHPNDKIVWFYDVALGTDDEIQELVKKARRQAEPTQEVIEQKVNGFRGDVQGAQRVSVPVTP